MYDFTQMRSLEESDSYRQNVDWGWGSGAEGGAGELVFNGDGVSVLQDEKGPADRWRGWLCNSMNMLNASELCTATWPSLSICYMSFTTI